MRVDIQTPAVVVPEEGYAEIVLQQPGAAGVVSAEVGAGLEVELDGADTKSIAVVRVWHDKTNLTERLGALSNLAGYEVAAVVEESIEKKRTIRYGSRSVRLSSLDASAASDELMQFVVARDAIGRIETPHSLKHILWLIARLSSKNQGADFADTWTAPSEEDVIYALMGVPEDARPFVEELIRDAASDGIVGAGVVDAFMGERPGVEAVSYGEVLFSKSLDVEGSARMRGLYTDLERPQRPLVRTDPSGAVWEGVTAEWIGESTVKVAVQREEGGCALWARARRDSDGVVVAATPLLHSGRQLEGLLLVAGLDHVVVDVVPGVDDPVLSHKVGWLARAFSEGRRAGRLERLGRVVEAEKAWQACARYHNLAGDVQREKIAMARGFRRRAAGQASLLDHIL